MSSEPQQTVEFLRIRRASDEMCRRDSLGPPKEVEHALAGHERVSEGSRENQRRCRLRGDRAS
jgi:hypothetical protein